MIISVFIYLSWSSFLLLYKKNVLRFLEHGCGDSLEYILLSANFGNELAGIYWTIKGYTVCADGSCYIEKLVQVGICSALVWEVHKGLLTLSMKSLLEFPPEAVVWRNVLEHPSKNNWLSMPTARHWIILYILCHN